MNENETREWYECETCGAPIAIGDICDHAGFVPAAAARVDAERFAFDAESEDSESCASRAAQILRALAPADVPAFVARLFGIPTEERHYMHNPECRLYDASDWRQRSEPCSCGLDGIPHVAHILVVDYGDIVEATALRGHPGYIDDRDGCKVGDSTLWSDWQAGKAALAAIDALGNFAYGAGPLDGYGDTIAELADAARVHMVEAVQWAAWNERESD